MRQEYRDKQNNQSIRHPDTQSNEHHASENLSIKRIYFICSINLFSVRFLFCPGLLAMVCFVVFCSTQYYFWPCPVLALFWSGVVCLLVFCLFYTILFLTLSCPYSVLVCLVVFCSTQHPFWPCPTSQAADGATPPNVSMATVQVTVQDANDNSPVFSQESYVGYLDENSPAATPVSYCPDCLASGSSRLKLQLCHSVAWKDWHLGS